MRVPACPPSSRLPTSDANAINISPSSSLRITVAFSPSQHKPIVLPNGTISTSPPYCSHTSQQVFVPHRPTFEPLSTVQASRSGSKDRQWHAALIAHLIAELREDGGSWKDVVWECRMGRSGCAKMSGGAVRRVSICRNVEWAAGGRSHCFHVISCCHYSCQLCLDTQYLVLHGMENAEAFDERGVDSCVII